MFATLVNLLLDIIIWTGINPYNNKIYFRFSLQAVFKYLSRPVFIKYINLGSKKYVHNAKFCNIEKKTLGFTQLHLTIDVSCYLFV